MKNFFRKNLNIIIPILAIVILGLILAKPYLKSLFQKQTISYKKTETDDGKGLDYYYKKARDLAGQNTQKTNVSFIAVGDIMLSRNVAGQIQKNKNPLLPFEKTSEIFKNADFAFGNLETPFTKGAGVIGGHSLVFSSSSEYIGGLLANKFKILNLATNHALDQGFEGLKYTINFLDQNQIKHIGAGVDLNKAWQPALVEEKGIQICFVGASYASINDNGKTTNNYIARIEDVENLKSQIQNLKSKCDFIVATMHAGTEYTRDPNLSEINFAHAAIDYGADMVIGSHPHWIQTIERYCPNSSSLLDSPSTISGEGAGGEDATKQLCPNPKYIFYSLGNFIFDQMWSQETREGLVLKITISKNQMQNPIAQGAASLDDLQGTRLPAKLESVELIPVVIDDYAIPRPATETESKKILEKIGQTETILK